MAWFNIENRDKGYVGELEKFLEQNYGFKIVSMKEGKRGWYGETWEVETDGQKYFLKIVYFEKQAKLYQKCFPVLEYMKQNGIDFISQVLHTKNKAPYMIFQGGTLAVFKYFEGRPPTEDGDDNPIRFAPYVIKIYNLPKPPFPIDQEDFSTNAFAYVKDQLGQLKKRGETEVVKILEQNWEFLETVQTKAIRYGELCKKKQNKFVISSGDIGGNQIINGDEIRIIDWDFIKLSPPERDFHWYAQIPGQIDNINKEFKRLGFDYTLDKERIAFYCFSLYIYFLGETLDCLLFRPDSHSQIVSRLKDHFSEDWYLRKCLRNAEEGL